MQPSDLRSPRPGSSPANRVSTPVDGLQVLGALSPSRASDFMTCPLLYRYRNIDRLPEQPSADALRGTLVHKVLEDLFGLEPYRRTAEQALAMLEPTWRRLCSQEPRDGALFTPDGATDFASWLETCRRVLSRYFVLEDPQRLQPAERELYVEALLEDRLLIRGFIDRVDVAPDGRVRVVDYKSGRSPGIGFESRALFQMKFYALVMWRSRGVLPAMLQLIYLGNGEILRHEPDEADLLATERKVRALWHAIRRAEESGDWQPSPSKLCDWCSFKELCPEFGGIPPDLPLPTPASPGAGVTPSPPSPG